MHAALQNTVLINLFALKNPSNASFMIYVITLWKETDKTVVGEYPGCEKET